MSDYTCLICGSGVVGACRARDEDGECARRVFEREAAMHRPGAKDDAGKPRYLLTLESFPLALAAVNTIAEYGARKYTRGGFLAVPDGVERYTEAMLRHAVCDAVAPASVDAEGLRHDACAAWNALARLELRLRRDLGR
jgi:hypothetical protein